MNLGTRIVRMEFGAQLLSLYDWICMLLAEQV